MYIMQTKIEEEEFKREEKAEKREKHQKKEIEYIYFARRGES